MYFLYSNVCYSFSFFVNLYLMASRAVKLYSASIVNDKQSSVSGD